MNKDVNLRSDRSVEKRWSDLIKANSKVKLQIDCIYNGSSKRPTSFDIKYWVDNQKPIELTIENN
ncbi:MAG: DNA/RNA non-specific endonuclease [Patescibacteria group bacterium]